jgi:hypothetical protein
MLQYQWEEPGGPLGRTWNRWSVYPSCLSSSLFLFCSFINESSKYCQTQF